MLSSGDQHGLEAKFNGLGHVLMHLGLVAPTMQKALKLFAVLQLLTRVTCLFIAQRKFSKLDIIFLNEKQLMPAAMSNITC